MGNIYLSHCALHIGFHGCDRSIGEKLLSDSSIIKPSVNDYDWLGSGFYIWEDNYERAKDWSIANKKNPFVIGVVYELGYCFDLMNSAIIEMIKKYNINFTNDFRNQGKEIPQNKDLKNDLNKDKILRRLDCALINYINQITDTTFKNDLANKGYSSVKPFDTVRGCFTEGAKIPGTEIFEKTHIQVCIRNSACIKGIFRPRIN